MANNTVRRYEDGQGPADEAKPAGSDYDTLIGASAASERRTAETAAKTAEALSSVAAWIERAQSQLTEQTQAATRTQEEAAAALVEAVGSLGHRLDDIGRKVEDTAPTLERIEQRLSSSPAETSSSPSGFDFEKALTTFENRMGELSNRIAAVPRRTGRRNLAQPLEIKSAIAQIREHQAHISPDQQRGSLHLGQMPPDVADQSHSKALSTLNGEVSKLSSQASDISAEIKIASDAVRDELGTIRELLSDRDKQTAFTHITDAMGVLTQELQGIRKLSIGLLSSTTFGGIETANSSAVPELASQLTDIHQFLAKAGTPQALELINTHLADLGREVAEIGDRQIDVKEFMSAKAIMEEIRGAVTRPIGRDPDITVALRDFKRPIEEDLQALARKVEQFERRIPDDQALHDLGGEIQNLASLARSIRESGSDFAGLERSINGLLSEVITWRSENNNAAEAAARLVVAEMLTILRPGPNSPNGCSLAEDIISAKADDGTVRRAFDGALSPAVATAKSPTSTSYAEGSFEVPRQRILQDPARSSEVREPNIRDVVMADDTHLGCRSTTEPEQEFLLEPGAARPATLSSNGFATSPQRAPEDIKSDFIAAARRAAQAASAEASGSRPRLALSRDDSGSLSYLNFSRILRRLGGLAGQRRKLLLSAAALIMIVGTAHLIRAALDKPPSPSGVVAVLPGPTVVTADATKLAVAPVTQLGSARPPASDNKLEPETTRSIAPVASTERTVGESRLPVPPRSQPDVASTRLADSEPPGLLVGEREKAPATPPASAQSRGQTDVTAPPTAPSSRTASLPDPGASLPPGLKQAATSGDPLALYELAARTLDGRGVPRDNKVAASLFEKAAEKGFPPAQYRIGNIYEKGIGVVRDIALAKLWYRKAAEGGNIRAMHNLAVLVADGGDAKPDYNGAVIWFTRAAERGVRDSQFNLAVLYARGLGTSQNLAKAYEWLARAALQGDDDAGKKRDEIGSRLSPDDLTKAKSAVEHWSATMANPAANDVQIPPGGWPVGVVKRASKDAKA